MSWSDPIDGRDPRRPGHLASRTPTPACSCATAWPAPTTPTSRCCSPPASDRVESYERLRRDPAPHDAARHRPRDQPRVPLRPGELVPGAATSWAKPTTKFVVPYLTLVGELAQEAHAHRPRLRLPADRAARATRGGRAARPLERHAPGARAQGDAARAAASRCCSRSRTSSRPGCSSIASTSPSRRPRASGSATRSRCWPRPTTCCTWTISPTRRRRTAIWDHDRELLDTRARVLRQARASARRAASTWPELDAALRGEAPAFGFDDDDVGAACARRTPATSSGSRSWRCCR